MISEYAGPDRGDDGGESGKRGFVLERTQINTQLEKQTKPTHSASQNKYDTRVPVAISVMV